MARRGRQIKIPYIQSYDGNGVFTMENALPLRGRPSKVLKSFVDFGFQKEWWDAKIFEDLIVFGWDRDYLKSDLPILTLPFKYFLRDMDWTKKKRLEGVDKNGE